MGKRKLVCVLQCGERLKEEGAWAAIVTEAASVWSLPGTQRTGGILTASQSTRLTV